MLDKDLQDENKKLKHELRAYKYVVGLLAFALLLSFVLLIGNGVI